MQKAIHLAKRISKELDTDSLLILEESNLHKTFESIYDLKISNRITNTLVCAIIYSYSPDSKWIDLKQDGYEINKNILIGLGADLKEPIYKEFIEISNTDVLDSVGNFLDLLSDWRFVTARKQIDFHAKYIREQEPDFTDVDEDKKIKARENIGKLMKEAVSQRKAADELLLLIEKDFVNTNYRTELDFGVKYSETEIKKDVMSWRTFIQERNKSKVAKVLP